MRAELEALRDVVAELSKTTCHIGQVTATAPPYSTLSSPAWGDPDDLLLAGPDSTGDVPVLLTLTDTTSTNVYERLRWVRDGLLAPVRLATPGSHVTAAWVRAEGRVQVDRDVTYGRTNRHPAFGNATIQVVSQPLD